MQSPFDADIRVPTWIVRIPGKTGMFLVCTQAARQGYGTSFSTTTNIKKKTVPGIAYPRYSHAGIGALRSWFLVRNKSSIRRTRPENPTRDMNAIGGHIRAWPLDPPGRPPVPRAGTCCQNMDSNRKKQCRYRYIIVTCYIQIYT